MYVSLLTFWFPVRSFFFNISHQKRSVKIIDWIEMNHFLLFCNSFGIVIIFRVISIFIPIKSHIFSFFAKLTLFHFIKCLVALMSCFKVQSVVIWLLCNECTQLLALGKQVVCHALEYSAIYSQNHCKVEPSIKLYGKTRS